MGEPNRLRKFLPSFAFICGTFLLMTSGAFAQSTLVTLEGVIIDQERSPLPGASITARNMETGYEYNCLSRPDGRYIISGIEPGKYEVRAGLPGFVTQTKQGLIFNVGASLKIDFQLAVAALKEEVVVTASAPMVEVAKSEISSVVNRREIDDQPLYDRDFNILSFIKPGVMGDRSNAQPQGSEEMLVDGISNEWVIRNGVRSQLPADAIEEFRVITNQYQAEFGNSSGMIRTAITRSGTNTLRGRVSFFSRDEVLDSVNYFVNHDEYPGEELPKEEWEKAPYEHYRFGGVLGGPVKKDKAHFFLAYDGLRQTTYSTVTSPLVPNETVDVGTNTNVALLKLSFQPSQRHLFAFRFSLQQMKYTNQGVRGFYTKERAYDNKRNCPEFQANWTFFLSGNSINEFRFLYANIGAEFSPRMPGSYTVNRHSGYFGKYDNLPQKTKELRYQIVDNLSFFLGNHSLKLGLDFSTIPFDGNLDQYIPGTYTFATDRPFNPDDPSTYPYSLIYNSSRFNEFDISTQQLGLFAQDSWRIHPRLTLNMGLRWNYLYNRYLDINHSDIRHLNPRFGLSWDPIGDGKTAIRAGVGTFTQNPMSNLSLLSGFLGQAEIRWVLYPGYPDPSKPNPFVPAVSGLVLADKYQSGKDLAPPFTVQTTLGFQRQFFTDFSVAADLVWSKGRHFTRGENANPVIPGTGNVRPDPTSRNVWVWADHGRSDYRALYLVLNKRYSHNWSLEVSYTLSRSWADVETEQTIAFSNEENAWDEMYGPTNLDARHKLVVMGIVDLPWGFQLSGNFWYFSALPWTAFYETDVNKDGWVTDQVDAHRNSRREYDRYGLSTRISYHLTIKRFIFQLFAEIYNVTDKANFGAFSNRFGTDSFGKPTWADIPRQIQLGARIDF